MFSKKRSPLLFKTTQPIRSPHRVTATEWRPKREATLAPDLPLLALMTGLNHQGSRQLLWPRRPSNGTPALLTVLKPRCPAHPSTIWSHFGFGARRSESILSDSMPDRKSYQQSIGAQTRRIGVCITLALLLVAAVRFLTKLYIVQEILVVLFLLAISTVTILTFAVAFMLLQEGIRRAALWTKIGLIRLAYLSPPQQ
jgi:hypothetical protein